MKIGILTQPLLGNYGGFLQAWALQEKLRQLGHEPVTIDYIPRASLGLLLLSWAKTFLYCILGRRRGFARWSPARPSMFEAFLRKNIVLTPVVHRYKSSIVGESGLEALVVGSDQVWRPCYNRALEDMFFCFARRCAVKRIAYAASFGVDGWEFSPSQTKVCARLAKRFDAISVREGSGVRLCKKHLGVEAVEVMDPTLFHGREAYEGLCLGTPRSGEGFLLCYILDASQEKEEFINKVANQRGLSVRLFRAGKHAELSVEEWIAMYRDAECVVTDSFHGTVFSILFHKPFFSIANENRGAERFRSLLVKFGLENRLLNHLHMVDFSEEIDWVHVDVRLDALRKEAVGFLNASLN